jgi:hypothetical protein
MANVQAETSRTQGMIVTCKQLKTAKKEKKVQLKKMLQSSFQKSKKTSAPNIYIEVKV